MPKSGRAFVMCLLKVYVVDEAAGRKLIARDVTFISWEDGAVKLRNIDFEETTLMNVDIVSIDALSSILLLKERKT